MVTQRKTTNSSTRSTRVTTDRRTRRTRTTTESSLVSAYVAEVPLKPAKVKDLLKIANKFLPPSTRSFYMSLKTAAPDAGNTDDHGNEHEDSD